MKRLSEHFCDQRRGLKNSFLGSLLNFMNSRGTRKKMTVLVDSWAWIEYFKGTQAGEKVKELLENSQDKIIVSTVNIAEVYNSFLRDYSHPDNKRYA